MRLFRRIRATSEAGAVALHYGLVLVFVAAACAAAVAVSGGWANDLFDAINRNLFSGNL